MAIPRKILRSLFGVGFLFPFLLTPLLSKKKDINKKDKVFYCNYNSSTNYIKSSKRDVILLYATSFAAGLELSIKSIRSTGSKCRVILLVPKKFPLTRFQQRMLEVLNIEIVLGCDEKKNRPFVPHMIRFEYELEWLEQHINEVDRVFHTDSFDVFFQGDPFSNHILNDDLTFVVEPHVIRSCGWNTDWLRRCYNDTIMTQMRHQYIICSGSIAGGTVPYIKLLKLMISTQEWDKCWGKSMDQPILNVLVWLGAVDQAGIKYHFAGCDSGFYTVQWCVLERNVLYNNHGQIHSLMNTVPSYIHQYNRLVDLTDYFFKRCRILSKD